jgi:hypothetical protein
MASTLNYTTVEDIENLLQVNVDDSFEPTVETWITVAERRVNNYLGYTTASGLWNEEVSDEIQEGHIDEESNLVVFPRKRPLNSVSSLEIIKGNQTVTIQLTDGSNPRYNIPTVADRLFYPDRELRLSSTPSFIHSFTDVQGVRFLTKMSYIGGYTSIPEDISLATAYFASDTFMRHANKEGLRSLTQGRVTKRWAEFQDGESDFIKEGKSLLNHYRIASGWV